MENKKAFEIGFNLIFALIAGAFILFFAIFGATNFIKISETKVNTETAASLISLFDPLETGLASGKSSEITFAKKSKLNFYCDENKNYFGTMFLTFSEQSFGNKYGEEGKGISIKDKYVFSENELEGKKIYYFTKPLFIGFKVSDLLMIYSDKNYCVYNSNEEFQNDIDGLNLKNIYFPNSTAKCEGIKVCFSSISGTISKCDIKIFENDNYLIKQGKKMYFKNDLIIAAIFSSPEIYECNIKRIKTRYNELAKIYLSKIEILERYECDPQLEPKLAEAINKKVENSRDLALFIEYIEDLDSINSRAKDGCKLYYNLNFDR